MVKAKKILVMPHYTPTDPYIYFYVGDKYYRRLQPIPYNYNHPDFKEIRKKICSNKK